MRRIWILLSFTRWWDKHGGNAEMSELQQAYQAGWKAALRHSKKIN